MRARTPEQRRKRASAFDRKLGSRLLAYRLHEGLTQGRVAHKTGFSISQISRYELGQCPIETSTLAMLARLYRCRPSDLIDGIEAP